MELITSVLLKALDNNIAYAVLMDIVVGFLFLFNILLGTIIGTKEDKFNAKKFFFGLLKALCLLIIIVGICYIVNVFVLTINLIEGLEFDRSLINTLQIIGIMITTGREILAECIQKLQSFKELKLTTNDIVLADTDINEPIEFKG